MVLHRYTDYLLLRFFPERLENVHNLEVLDLCMVCDVAVVLYVCSPPSKKDAIGSSSTGRSVRCLYSSLKIASVNGALPESRQCIYFA